jgi:hypothetical protein
MKLFSLKGVETASKSDVSLDLDSERGAQFRSTLKMTRVEHAAPILRYE